MVLLAACTGSGSTGVPGTGDDGSAGSNTTSPPVTDTDTDTEGSTDTDEPLDPNAITYYGHVLPIFAERCLACHTEGSIGPMALDDYETAVTWAPIIEPTTHGRIMPPWYLTADGSCQDFLNSQWMSDDELETISEWIAWGTPRGPAGDPVPPPPLPQLDHVSMDTPTPVFVPEIQGPPLQDFDEYRCFVMENHNDEDVFMTGYDIVPGNDAIVHHAVGFVVELDGPSQIGIANRTVIAGLELLDNRPGHTCLAGPGLGVSYTGTPIAWAPGQGAVNFPNEIGVRLAAGESLILQMHFNLSDPKHLGESDQTRVLLELEDAVPREGYIIIPDPFLEEGFGADPPTIPAGDPAWQYTWFRSHDRLLRDAELEPGGIDGFHVVGVMPHMHAIGSKMFMDVHEPGGKSFCAVDLFQWDFGWQKWYFYDTPVPVERGGQVEVTCEWDASNLSEPTVPGFGTNDEMCLMTMLLVP